MIDYSQLEDIFAKGGLLEKGLENFEKRDDQLSMAWDVAQCYNEDRKGVIEAGTGTGKSYAYLAPAILHALEAPEDRTVIATSNVALQQQLMNKDLPSLVRLLGTDVSYCLLLGRARYVCTSKMLNAVSSFRDRTEALFSEAQSDEERIYAWFRSTATGIVEELDHPLLSSPFLSRVRCDRDSCTKQRCRHFSSCFYYNALEKASKSRIIVTNHALLFIDSSIRIENHEDYDDTVILPPYSRLIIDECHNIDKAATEFYSLSLDNRSCAELWRKLFAISFKEKEGQHLADILSSLNREATAQDARLLESSCSAFGSQLKFFLADLIGPEERRKFKSQCLVTDTAESFSSRRADVMALISCLDDIRRVLRIFLSGKGQDDDEIYVRMGRSVLESFDSYHTLLSLFLEHDAHRDLVFHYRYGSDRDSTVMMISPLSVASKLNETIFSRLSTVVCTSATVKAGKDFSYFLAQTGLDSFPDLITGFYASPFDYEHNALLLYPDGEDGMGFNIGSRKAYAHYLASLITDAVSSSEGSALVLFTSNEMMETVYEEVKDRISARLLIQRRGTSAEKLRREFIEDESSVLFGVRSFWEGIDVPGQALKLLIITQLPFPHVEDPVKRSRCEAIAAAGENPYMKIELPEMLITLKQGLGRLIRSESDRGVAVIADARAKRYISLIRACIPPYSTPEGEMLNVSSFASRIENFLY